METEYHESWFVMAIPVSINNTAWSCLCSVECGQSRSVLEYMFWNHNIEAKFNPREIAVLVMLGWKKINILTGDDDVLFNSSRPSDVYMRR